MFCSAWLSPWDDAQGEEGRSHLLLPRVLTNVKHLWQTPEGKQMLFSALQIHSLITKLVHFSTLLSHN